MIQVNVSITPTEWKACRKWRESFKSNMTDAMWRALNALHTRIRLNLSGPSHTKFPGNGNPFPGVVTGRLRNSVTAQLSSYGTEFRGIVGPDVWYAVNHELGRGVPMRPYLAPAFRKERQYVRRVLEMAIKESFE
jgi:phage gpG-like protein